MLKIANAVRRATQVFVALATTLGAGQALAHNVGVVSGKVRFQQNQGGFCPTWISGRDCTGSRYTSTEAGTYIGIKHTKLYARDQNKNVIGEGVTDWDGNFEFEWESSSLPTSMHLAWKYEHKDGRFALKQPNGSGWVTKSFTRTPVNHGTTTFAADLGPLSYANVYDGAARMWYKALGTSGLMDSRFTGLKILVWDPREVCDSGHAWGSLMEICLNEDAAYRSQARVLHEMGHIASYLSQPDAAAAEYGYDGDTGWGYTSHEYLSRAFEEGIATFFGDVTFYNASAVEPYTCNSISYCSGSDRNLETNTSYSSTDERGRWPLSYARAFWDAFDESNEDYDNDSMAYWYFFTALDEFPSGTDWLDAAGVFYSNYTCCDDPDVRSGKQYNTHMANRRGVYMTEEFEQNQIDTFYM